VGHAVDVAMATPEYRIDPKDGQARTFAELQQLTQHAYSPQQIREYWETRCKPVPEDPFLSQLQQGDPASLRASRSLASPYGLSDEPPTRPASQAQVPGGRVDLSQNPFMTANPVRTSVKQDPFLTAGVMGGPGGQLLDQVGPQGQEVEQFKEEFAPTRHWTESFYSMLGHGDRDRKPRAQTILTIVPLVLFVWELFLWTLLQHISTNACWLMTLTLAVVSAAGLAMWYTGVRWGPVSLLALGSLCLLAILTGTYLGELGWIYFWQGFWWMNIGQQSVATTASTLAGARIDAATLSFHTASNDTSVDASRSAGYKDTDTFCVAPIMSPETAGADFPRVNFWAVGVNCCEKYGSFTCDASRSPSAASGVVQLNGGFPCPSCNNDKFALAISKAESQYGLVSAPDALLLRWVASTSQSKFDAACWAIGSLLCSGLLGGLFLYALGWFAWYYGFGKTGIGSFEDAEAAREKRVQ